MRNTALVPKTSRSASPEILTVREYRERLRPYLLALVSDYALAQDILERTCAVLGKKEGKGFRADRFWKIARPVARQQAISVLKKPFYKPRLLDDRALSAIEAAIERTREKGSHLGDLKVAVTRCINSLPADSRRLLRMRYWNGMSSGEVAGWVGKSPDEVKGMIGRVKAQLADCVSNKVAS